MNNIIYLKVTNFNFNYNIISYNVKNNVVFDFLLKSEGKVSSNFRFFV